MSAREHGIDSVGKTNWITRSQMRNDLGSATMRSYTTSEAWFVFLADGETKPTTKNETKYVARVR